MAFDSSIERFNQSVKPERWKMLIDHSDAAGIFDVEGKLLEEKADLLLAMCLNNGYYNRENVYRILKFALASSDRVQIFMTDGPARHNYRAMGASENDLIRDTRLARNRLRNQCMDALQRINAGLPAVAKRIITFMDWEAIYADEMYKKSYSHLKDLYKSNANFSVDIQRTSREVLSNRIGIPEKAESVLETAVEYVIEELAFLISYSGLSHETKPLADHGSKTFNYTYYERWPVFENLVNGKYDGRVRSNIGFVIAKIETF